MYNIEFGKSGLSVPTVAVGCMRISHLEEKQVDEFVATALENNANFFDHADIYGAGKSEEFFGKAIKKYDREKITIQTKCGIVPGKAFDFSYEHIINSVNGSLKRLDTDYIDVLLLHRPDALVEPEEVAKAFAHLKESGKVRHFGVSNQNPYQMELLQKYIDMPICTNKLQLSIMHTPMIQSGLNVNMYNDSAVNRDGGVLDYCRLKGITIQPWSPMQHGFLKGCFVDNDQFPELNAVLEKIANKYNVSKTTIAIAWLLRHPAKMQPVTGTTKIQRLKDSFKATEITLSREEWYEIYKSAGNVLP
jgi:predicted oxidoreductase